MNHDNERKAFEAWAYSNKWNIFRVRDMGIDKYVDDFVDGAWHGWLASANREGYKLVPMEMSWQKADELASKEWDKNKSMFCVDNRDMSALQVEEFRLRWCKNKAYQIMSDYKAMIGACDE